MKKVLFTLAMSLGMGVTAQTYCTPQTTIGSSGGQFIKKFQTFGAISKIINNQNAQTRNPWVLSGNTDPHYSDFTTMSVEALPGSTITFKVKSHNVAQRIGVWIDWNQDGDFNDANEYIAYFGLSTQLQDGTINVPQNAVIGSTRIRIRSNGTQSGNTCIISNLAPTAPNSCADLYSGETEDYTFIVADPTPPCPTNFIVANGKSQVVCDGGYVDFGATGASNIAWSNGVPNNTLAIAHNTDDNPKSVSYVVTGVDANGCVDKDTINVVISPRPEANITSNGHTTTICEGSSVALEANSGYSYLWSNGDTTQTIDASLDGQYTVTTTNSYGCSFTSLPTTVWVSPGPNMSEIGGVSDIIVGETIYLTNSVTGGYWYSSDESIMTVSGVGETTGFQVGTATITYLVYGTGGCQDSRSVELNVVPFQSPLAPTTNVKEIVDYSTMSFKYYNLMGQPIPLDSKGLVLKVYENGHSEKLYIVK